MAMCVDSTVTEVTMRNIREAKKLTTGARGVNAPDMTYLDAARTLIAQILDENPGRASVTFVNTFGPLQWANSDHPWAGDPFTLQALAPGAPIDTLEQAIAALIRVFAECRADPRMIEAGTRLRDGGWLYPKCRIEVFPRDRWARIDMASALYDFGEFVTMRDWTPDHDEQTRLGRQSICFVNQEVIARIADGFIATAGD